MPPRFRRKPKKVSKGRKYKRTVKKRVAKKKAYKRKMVTKKKIPVKKIGGFTAKVKKIIDGDCYTGHRTVLSNYGLINANVNRYGMANQATLSDDVFHLFTWYSLREAWATLSMLFNGKGQTVDYTVPASAPVNGGFTPPTIKLTGTCVCRINIQNASSVPVMLEIFNSTCIRATDYTPGELWNNASGDLALFSVAASTTNGWYDPLYDGSNGLSEIGTEWNDLGHQVQVNKYWKTTNRKVVLGPAQSILLSEKKSFRNLDITKHFGVAGTKDAPVLAGKYNVGDKTTWYRWVRKAVWNQETDTGSTANPYVYAGGLYPQNTLEVVGGPEYTSYHYTGGLIMQVKKDWYVKQPPVTVLKSTGNTESLPNGMLGKVRLLFRQIKDPSATFQVILPDGEVIPTTRADTENP